MNKEMIYSALEYVRDEYLDSAADAMTGKRKKRYGLRYLGVAAACLVLAGAIAAVPLLRDYEIVEYSATDIADFMKCMTINDSATNQYTKVYLPDADYLGLNDLPEDEYLPIYSMTTEGKALDEDALRDFADERIDRLTEAMGIERPELELGAVADLWLHYDNFDADNEDYYHISASQLKLTEYIGVASYSDTPSIALDGEQVAIRQTESDEEIIASLASIKEKLFDIFGESFKDAKVLRDYDANSEYGVTSLTVYFYDADDHPLNETSDKPESNYISLYFENYENFSGDTVSDDLLTNVTICYEKYRVKPNKVWTVAAKAKTLPLDEAEKLLAKGYVFGGHSCELCMAAQEKVDFSEYDYVSFEYVLEPNDQSGSPARGIPFYAFYKQIGRSDNGNLIYAKTYVPAIEVSGLDEYFAGQAAEHQAANTTE